MNLSHELTKIKAQQEEASLARSLNKDEIERLVAAGSITPLEQIPRERCMSRISVPETRNKSSYQRRNYR